MVTHHFLCFAIDSRGEYWGGHGKFHGKKRERENKHCFSNLGLSFMSVCIIHTHSLKIQRVLNDNPISQYTSYRVTLCVLS